ncbi:MAG: hypothetical protein P0Y53_11550 [Candidatus Pseudobacter hemicellulosilyticus]|uniref:Outer membrane protein beta-barrel domain-containing protein n=1 Tax=Candidatus Pseudobacter hemicellulosilyticus TaxID=3121375 RepID=A0AAJ5WYY4_9BACT|nr:MAG: hypothetical protein P0Y53_11550 [Pseudobacter sp.]
MSDLEFEKQVQSRLDELKLRPTATVWTNVERRIRQARRRRRVILWLPTALLLLGTGSYFLFSQGPAGQDGQPVASTHTAIPSTNSDTTTTYNLSATENNSTLPASNADIDQPAHTPVQQQPAAGPVSGQQAPAVTAAPAPANVVTAASRLRKNGTQGNTTGNSKGKNSRTGNRDRSETERQQETHLVADKAGKAGKQPAADQQSHQPGFDSAVAVVSEEPTLTQELADPLAEDNTAAAPQPVIAAVPEEKTTAAPGVIAALPTPKKKNDRRGWQFGITGMIGGSHVDKKGLFDLLSKENIMQEDLSANRSSQGFAIPGGNPTLPRISYKPSPMKTGLYYSIGAFAQKPLSRTFSMSAGVQFTQFTVKTQVGNLIRYSRMVSNAVATSQVVDQYYQGSTNQLVSYWAPTPSIQEYTNRYNLWEVPITGHLQLNKGKRLPPLIWDLGFTFAKLQYTNALHYDGTDDIYYSNVHYFNKVQSTTFTGVSVSLFSKTAHPLLVGPRINYQFSNLLDKDVSDGQHLWSFGLNARWFLKK